MPLFFLLVLEVLSLILIPSETVIYYVTPTEPPNPDCPGQPCQTLDYYFSHKEEYFNSNKINVTMLLMGGKHILSWNHTKSVNIESCGYTMEANIIIRDLEMFEMIGLESAHDVVVQLFTNINLLVNINKVHFVSITIFNMATNQNLLSSLDLITIRCVLSANTSQSEKIASVDNVTFITVVNGTIFNGVLLDRDTLGQPINFSTTLANSLFDNRSAFTGFSIAVWHPKNYIRELIVTNCTFSNSNFQLQYELANILIFNSTLRNIIRTDLFSGGDALAAYLSSNVKIIGDVTFADNVCTVISAYSSTITLSGNISFLNNTGVNGGAMALYSSTLNIASNTTVYFYNNRATETGRAIYVDNDSNQLKFSTPDFQPCFYQLPDYDDKTSTWYNISFHNNSATKGGDHIYGAFMHSGDCYVALGDRYDYDGIIPSYCAQKYFHYEPKSSSSVSSDPIRVCTCKSGSQQCSDIHSIEVHPGETFTLSVVVVGADLGTTFGSVHARFNSTTTVQLKPSSQYIQGIRDIRVCSELNYTIFSQNMYEILALTTKQLSWITIKKLSSIFYEDDCFCRESSCAKDYVSANLLYSLLLLNVTLLRCPLGFQLIGDPPGCDCHSVLTKNNVKCLFINSTGYHIWSGPLWFDIMNGNNSDINLALAPYCPFDYCKKSEKSANLESDSSAQCAFNHTGKLCGGCRNGYSLAIGSSHCIKCSNNNNLALLIFFAVAGLLLVAIIGAFNLTITQGMINGLVFYANIIWTYQRILFHQEVELNFALVFLRTIMAWLNLDFGIQTCFIKGLNAIHKTWPQYLFILYIWGIAMAIIFSASRSTKLTNLLGNRPVPILVTLFLLSYTKLLQIVIASVGFTQINVFGANRNLTQTVWSLDGNYMYLHYPHVMLFTAALLVFLFVWLPYTLVLFSVQWLRKMSHLKLLKWVPKFNPIYDAHFAPLKDKHHYWFGVLLIVRGILLIILTLTYTVYPKINYIVLLVTASLLLIYSNYHRVFKNRLVQLNENFFLFLLIILGGTGVLEEQTRRIVVYASVGVGLLVFCGIVIRRSFKCCCKKGKIERDFIPNEQRKTRQEISHDAQFRDSILDETDPLLGDAEAIQDVATY